MASPYIYERQSEYWASRQIEEFFLDAGFQVIAFPLTQYNERLIPSDFIYFDKKRSKLFGFQYKALYHNKMDYWPIDSAQHRKILNYPWIYYCLSELRSPEDYRIALHLVRIVDGKEIGAQARLYPRGPQRLTTYSRWAAFYQGLGKCYHGIVIESRAQLNEILTPQENVGTPWELADLLVDVFLTDFFTRNAVHFSPFLREYRQADFDEPSPDPSLDNPGRHPDLEDPCRTRSRLGYLEFDHQPIRKTK